MSFVIKLVLCIVLFVQFSIAEAPLLAYQTSNYKKAASWLNEQPTYGDLILRVALAKMDPDFLSVGNRMLMDKGLSKKDKIPEIEITGNQISIKGLKKKIIVSNSYDLELTYNGDKIPYNKSASIEKNIKAIESFFSKQDVSYLYHRLILGENAQAASAILIGLLLGTLVIISYIGWDMSRGNGTSFSEWFLSPSGLDKDIEFKCENGQFTIVNGPESLSFKASQTMADEKVAPSRKGYVYDMHTVTYYNKKNSKEGYQSISYFADNSEPYVREKFFNPPNYSQQKITDLGELARNVLGDDGKRQICNGNKFVNVATQSKFEELQKAVNTARRSKDKKLLEKVKQLDSGNQAK